MRAIARNRNALALALHTEAAEAAYLSGHFDTMERLTTDVLGRARTVVDKARVYEIRVRAYAMQSTFDAALQAGLEGLRLLGVAFPSEPGQAHIQQGMQAMYALLAVQPLETLATLPDMTEPRAQAALLIFEEAEAAVAGAEAQLAGAQGGSSTAEIEAAQAQLRAAQLALSVAERVAPCDLDLG